jgi:hypothetical protein
LPAVFGFVAMTLPLVTLAYTYAYEGRPYGLVLGFSSLCLVCWQEATDRPRRSLWLIGMTLSGAAAISCHYYAVFLCPAIGCGELVRSLARRRVDLPVWIALSCTLLPLAAYLPLIQAARTYSPHFWAKPEWIAIYWFYYVLLAPAAVPLVAALVVSSVWTIRGNAPDSEPARTVPAIPLHEVAAAAGFALIPLMAVPTAIFVTNAFTYCYALWAVIGVTVLTAMALSLLEGGRTATAALMVVVTVGWFLTSGWSESQVKLQEADKWTNVYKFLETTGDPSLPIVVSEWQTFNLLAYNAPGEIKSRLVYLADPSYAVKYAGYDNDDRGGLDLRPWFPRGIQEYDSFVAAHAQYLVLSGNGNGWLVPRLRWDSARLELQGKNGDLMLFGVSSIPSPAPAQEIR